MGTEIRITYFVNKISSHNYVATLRATGETFAKNSSALFMETSAKDGTNVQELFKTIGKLVGIRVLVH